MTIMVDAVMVIKGERIMVSPARRRLVATARAGMAGLAAALGAAGSRAAHQRHGVPRVKSRQP
jgi:hypothetical protein